MNHCKITEDLLPLYVDGLTSQETNEFVRAHVDSCPNCQRLLKKGSAPIEKKDEKKSGFKKALTAEKRRRILTAVLIVVLAALVCAFLLQEFRITTFITRQTSPDGEKVISIHNYPHRTDWFDVIHEVGPEWARQGHYGFGGKFENMYFSPSGDYLILEASNEWSSHWLYYFDYNKTVTASINTALESECMRDPDFASDLKETDIWVTIDFRFMEWHPEKDLILFAYTYETVDGQQDSGYFWFDLGAWEITDIIE